MNNISFTTTATCRPDLLASTYKSFTNNLHGIDLKNTTLYINIDPLPQREYQEETLKVAKEYFGVVNCNMPETPNFTAAINWLWNNADTEYIFHLEDDWLLTKAVDMQEIMKLFKDDVMEVALRAYKYEYKKLCLSPSIWSKALYGKFAGTLDETKNPEIQLRQDFVSPSNIACFGKHPIVKDIGRSWLSDTGLRRPKTKVNFTSWESK